MTERPTVEKTRCEATFMDDTGWHLTQCSRNGKYEEEGKHWCRQHSPSATKARQKASDQRYEAISRRNSEKWAEQRERDRRAECFPDLVAALENCADWLLELSDYIETPGLDIENGEAYRAARAALAKAKS